MYVHNYLLPSTPPADMLNVAYVFLKNQSISITNFISILEFLQGYSNVNITGSNYNINMLVHVRIVSYRSES